jgi:hypothetical protein
MFENYKGKLLKKYNSEPTKAENHPGATRTAQGIPYCSQTPAVLKTPTT